TFAAGIFNESKRSDSDQLRAESAVGHSLAHHFHHARLCATVDNHSVHIHSCTGDAAAKQLCKLWLEGIGQVVCSADDHEHRLMVHKIQSVNDVSRLVARHWEDCLRCTIVFESN